MNEAIVLCSGGLDSVVTAYYVKKKLGLKNVLLLFFDYSQRNVNSERKASKLCATDLNFGFKEISLAYIKDLSNSMLNSSSNHKGILLKDLKETSRESKKWYVPCRNLIFLSNAIAFAEANSSHQTKIFVGFKNEGKDGYVDASEGFLKSINVVSRFGSNSRPKILAPLIKKDKEDIIKLGESLNVDLSKTFSCYTSNAAHCGTCLSCRLRQEAFYWANVRDQTFYKIKSKDFRLSD